MFSLDSTVFTLHDDIVIDDDFRLTNTRPLSFDVLTTKIARPRAYSAEEQYLGMIEPTPIGTKGITVVSSLPLDQVSKGLAAQNYQLTPTPLGKKRELPSPLKSQREPKESILAEKWNKRFQELVAFREEHGHCLVPVLACESSELANWVKRQRNQYRRKMEGKPNTLCDQRQADLEAVGFVWDSRTTSWNERYQELFDFWLENGNSRVPKSYKKNPQLAIWVKHQRRQYKKRLGGNSGACFISDERIRLLKALDFDFAPHK